MGWATPYIAKLKNGETVSFRPRGQRILLIWRKATLFCSRHILQ